MNTSSHLERVTTKIGRGELALGTVISGTDPVATELLATCGYDFLWIDMEHSPNSLRDVSLHIMAARGQGVAPFVRVPWNDPVLIKPVLEMGPAALVVPFVNTAQEAARAVAACRYPPAGTRGFGPQRADGYGSVALTDYLSRAESEPWVVLQIEHVEAVRNLEEICAVPGVGSLLVGPFDLSASVGRPGDINHPDVAAQLEAIGRVARAHGTPLGAFALSSDEQSVVRWIGRGASWLALDTDQALLRRAASIAISAVTRLGRE